MYLYLQNKESKCNGSSTLKRSNQRPRGNTGHPLAALGSFFSGGKNINVSSSNNGRPDDLGSDGMSGSGSGSGSSGANNSARNIIMTSTENGVFLSGAKVATFGTCVGNANLLATNQEHKGDGCVQRNNQSIVMPVAAVHAAMSSSTLDRQFPWRHQFDQQQQEQQQSQFSHHAFGRLFPRNNSLGHAILPSHSQHTIPFAIDPKYDSDSDFDYRQRLPRCVINKIHLIKHIICLKDNYYKYL